MASSSSALGSSSSSLSSSSLSVSDSKSLRPSSADQLRLIHSEDLLEFWRLLSPHAPEEHRLLTVQILLQCDAKRIPCDRHLQILRDQCIDARSDRVVGRAPSVEEMEDPLAEARNTPHVEADLLCDLAARSGFVSADVDHYKAFLSLSRFIHESLYSAQVYSFEWEVLFALMGFTSVEAATLSNIERVRCIVHFVDVYIRDNVAVKCGKNPAGPDVYQPFPCDILDRCLLTLFELHHSPVLHNVAGKELAEVDLFASFAHDVNSSILLSFLSCIGDKAEMDSVKILCSQGELKAIDVSVHVHLPIAYWLFKVYINHGLMACHRQDRLEDGGFCITTAKLNFFAFLQWIVHGDLSLRKAERRTIREFQTVVCQSYKASLSATESEILSRVVSGKPFEFGSDSGFEEFFGFCIETVARLNGITNCKPVLDKSQRDEVEVE